MSFTAEKHAERQDQKCSEKRAEMIGIPCQLALGAIASCTRERRIEGYRRKEVLDESAHGVDCQSDHQTVEDAAAIVFRDQREADE